MGLLDAILGVRFALFGGKLLAVNNFRREVRYFMWSCLVQFYIEVGSFQVGLLDAPYWIQFAGYIFRSEVRTFRLQTA